MDDDTSKHWHTTMESHGTERDSVHKYGHIPHVHGRPIDLTTEYQSRKIDVTNNQEGDSQ
jgi:hypothetical protein